MSLEHFPCPRCRRAVAATAICTCALTLVAPVRHWPFVAADMPHTHQEPIPMQMMGSLTLTAGSTVTSGGATYDSSTTARAFYQRADTYTRRNYSGT